MKQVEYYRTAHAKEPCREWLLSLDLSARRKVFAYILRAAQGAAKRNIRSLGDGVFEIKLDFGPGYRVYFGEEGNVMLLLLIGGDKSTQFRDIRRAKEFWRDYCVSK